MRPRSIIGAPPQSFSPSYHEPSRKGSACGGGAGLCPRPFLPDRWVFQSNLSGRTHRSAPTRWGRYSEPTGIGMKGRATGRDGARPLQGIGAGWCVRRRGAPGVWLPPAKFRFGIWGVSQGHPALRVQRWWCAAAGRCGHRPLRIEGEAVSTTRASGAQRSVCGAVARDG